MDVSCILCNSKMDTKKEDVIVTVNWVCSDLAKQNNIQVSKNLPRIVKICTNCWNNGFKDKPEGKNYYWTFNKAV